MNPPTQTATKVYEQSARKATLDGHRPGSHAWWNAIRRYNALDRLTAEMDDDEATRLIISTVANYT